MKKNIMSYSEEGEPHGYWEMYYGGNNNMAYNGFYENGKQIGYYEYYSIYGKLETKKYYIR